MFTPARWIRNAVAPRISHRERRYDFYLVLFLILICLSACATTDQGVSESWDIEGLRLTLSSSKLHYDVGEEVTITVKVENITDYLITWKSAKTDNPEYILDVYVDGVVLSKLYPELQVYSREMKPGEKIVITYSFKPEKQDDHYFDVEAHIFSPDGTSQGSFSVSLIYGIMAK
jgi:hypothetical protein